ncbi:MAG: hypothetical protein COV66_08030 [Nitrospinae bacterium CG11_big_fil_rev_8_21_14_0_20_45_15]|nr:MAG: hypothetical protein COV66_08030 [Nitrospinae bacterium CG11_big_fil_rev_8_21_14_0_20_45_15]
MPIHVNPPTRNIRIPVGENQIILKLRNYTAPEYSQFMRARYEIKKGNRFTDKSHEARIQFVDLLLVDVCAEDAEGNKDTVVFSDPADGQTRELTAQVPDWKSHLNPSWKISAAMELEGQSAELEHDSLKN